MTKRIQNIRTTILRNLVVVAMIVCGAGESWGQTYEIAKTFTTTADLQTLVDQKVEFAIVKTSESKALYGTYNENVGYEAYAKAFASNNSVVRFKLEKTDAGYLFRAVTPTGGDYNIWGYGIDYLNAQQNQNGKVFILSLSGRNGRDMQNGAVWTLAYDNNQKGWSMLNVGNGAYCAGTKTSTTASYWQFVTFKQATTLTFDSMEPTLSGNGIQLPSVALTNERGAEITGKTINYSGTNCTVSSTGVVTDIQGNTATVTATFAGDGDYFSSSVTYNITATEHAAKSETTCSDISITPSSASLDLNATQTYSIPLTADAVLQQTEAYTEYTFPVGTLYKLANGSYSPAAPTFVATTTGSKLDFTEVTWTFNDGAGNYYTPSTYHSTSTSETKNILTLTRSSAITASDKTFIITAEVTYGTAKTTAYATVTIPSTEVDLTSISATNMSVGVGETKKIEYTYQPNYDSGGKPYIEINYTASNSKITVDANGFITGISEGSATVTLTTTPAHGGTAQTTQIEVTVSNGTGGSGDPYKISSVSDLNNIEDNSSASFLVTADIDASDFEGGIDGFSGTFDGNYHTISGLKHALFNTIDGGTVKNVIVKDVKISANSSGNAGAIANETTGAKIYNCGVLAKDGSSSVIGSGSGSAGGIVGSISGTKVVNCYNYATISGGTNAAGVVGYNSGSSSTTLIADMFQTWSGYRADATSTGNATCDNNWGKSANTLYGNGSNVNTQYANLSDYSKLSVTVTNGSLRFFFNMQDGSNSYITVGNNSNYDGYKYLSISNGVWTVDIAAIVKDNGCAHLNSIKAGSYNTNATASNPTLTKNTIVANCINYAPQPSGTNVYPVYGGSDLDNKTQPLYDFFLYEGVKTYTSTNSALPAEERFLNRFEYVRATLNAERKLMAYYLWATQPKSTENEVGKWVLDKSIAPYPIIKPQGKYPSLINPDFESRNVGHLSVTITGYSGTVSLPITDQKEDEFDYGYHKVQLPYYNDYFTNNYQANKVVTGWKITSVSGGTAGTFSTSGTNAYNYADRNCTEKDLYRDSDHRIFAQGGFYYVPEGVTAITIEPYWATDVVYAYDPNIDKVFGMGYTESNYGPTYTPTFTVPYGAKTATSLKDAHDKLTASTNVYDHAIVLIGNLNFRKAGYDNILDLTKAYTIMSIDEDKDDEPDYCEIYGHETMRNIPPTRYDFIHQVGISWVKKPMGETVLSYSGIAMTSGQFEITETAFARFTEFETGDHDNYNDVAPLIFNAGLIDQFVTYRSDTNDKINYAILGGHTYFKAYTPGCHATNAQKTKFFPVSVMGGEYDEFYLTGRNANVNVAAQNGRVYTNGGKIGTFAGGYWEQLKGNAYIRFDHTQVDEFYGGSVNPAKPITGDIDIIINNCNVNFFCGGPKAGNMTEGKTVTTVANNTTFGTFVGAGYGGSSVGRVEREQNVDTHDYAYYKEHFFNSYFGNNDYLKYSSSYDGILIRYAIEFMPCSGGTGASKTPEHVTRFSGDYAQLSLARTYNVTSTLTGCTVTGNYYGGPWSGTVGTGSGTTPTVTSTLTNCTVSGSVFGGGKSAEIPTITVYPKEASALKTPLYDGNYGVYYQDGETEFPVYPTGTEYKWVKQTGDTPSAEGNTLETNVDLDNLGTIFGNTSLTIDGGSVAGSVYGAGDASKVAGSTDVTIENGARITGNVFGGGNEADCGGSTEVNIEGGTVSTAVYGGGALANVTGDTEVNLKGGTVNDVYGGGLGRQTVGTEGQTGYVAGIAATVGDAIVNIGSGTPDDSQNGGAKDVAGSCVINGSVYGCNNLNGTPTGDATVNVYMTYNANPTEQSSYNNKIAAVYGGGNKAAYIPANPSTSTNGTHVNIYTCKNQIENVYGGGNAASCPATNLLIWGGKFDWVFGGGNGAGEGNPGANVGYYTYTDDEGDTKEKRETYAYGSGEANTTVHDGIIKHLFGGSNTKGNIRISSITDLDDKGCDFTIGEVYAAGNEAFQDGTAILNIGCIPGLGVLYGGARKANINNDIQLTIKGGTYGQIFGGNNVSGNINGSIKVNIEETGCNPIVIGEVYGGGNQAPYTTPEGKDGPTVNAYSFTKIGAIYGGGYGETAVVTGNTTVNVQQLAGKHAASIDANGDGEADKNASALGIVGTIYGGGNAAMVDGNTNVNIGTAKQVTFLSSDADDNSWTATKDVLGANIQPVTVTVPVNITGDKAQTYTGTGNVFGGGNNAEVTGKTDVVIGADKQ